MVFPPWSPAWLHSLSTCSSCEMLQDSLILTSYRGNLGSLQLCLLCQDNVCTLKQCSCLSGSHLPGWLSTLRGGQMLTRWGSHARSSRWASGLCLPKILHDGCLNSSSSPHPRPHPTPGPSVLFLSPN